MSKETADKAIEFFIKQIKLSGLDTEENKYVANKINSLRGSEKCIKNLEMSMVTNGVLLNKNRVLRLQELGVAITIPSED